MKTKIRIVSSFALCFCLSVQPITGVTIKSDPDDLAKKFPESLHAEVAKFYDTQELTLKRRDSTGFPNPEIEGNVIVRRRSRGSFYFGLEGTRQSVMLPKIDEIDRFEYRQDGQVVEQFTDKGNRKRQIFEILRFLSQYSRDEFTFMNFAKKPSIMSFDSEIENLSFHRDRGLYLIHGDKEICIRVSPEKSDFKLVRESGSELFFRNPALELYLTTTLAQTLTDKPANK